MSETQTPSRTVGQAVISSDPSRTPGRVVKVDGDVTTVRWCYGLETEFHGYEFENFCERI